MVKYLNKSILFSLKLLFLSLPHLSLAQNQLPTPSLVPSNYNHELFAGPKNNKLFPQWLSGMKKWREDKRAELLANHVDLNRIYQDPTLFWTQADYMQTQLMAQDLYFYDPVHSTYTVDAYLADLNKRYGGIDSVLLWPTYPNIGVDNRNQYDLTRDLPGGIEGLRSVVDQFHARGVHVLLPFNPWDNGTRDEGLDGPAAIARILNEIGADGFNGDTMLAPEKTYFDASLSLSHPIAIEPERAFEENFAALSWTPISWGYWYDYPEKPGVDRYKWLETRHKTHVCDRWQTDRTDALQYAWFNGAGYESWENLWGIWNGITPRDASAMKRISILSHAFSRFLLSADWEPHTPTQERGIYASRFPLDDSETLWTIINRSDEDLQGHAILTVQDEGQAFYDLWNGVELTPIHHDSRVTLFSPVEKHGFGAILATRKTQDSSFFALLSKMRALSETPLSNLSNHWTPEPQVITSIEKTKAATTLPPGMVLIPKTKNFTFKVSGIELEQDLPKSIGVDIQYPWEKKPKVTHRKTLSIPAFYIDQEPVTNLQFSLFLKAKHYRPADTHNFLADWPSSDWRNPIFPEGGANRPVTWVSLEDARAYAKWAHKRLPHEWEWQYAAQGNDSRLYPWGKTWDPNLVPKLETGRTLDLPQIVGQFPNAASPFGVLDLVGNVWQWTDEFSDRHTRAAIVRGGSSYQPQGSRWYFPNAFVFDDKEKPIPDEHAAFQLDHHGKYLLMAPSIDRSGRIGFRCVVDAKPSL